MDQLMRHDRFLDQFGKPVRNKKRLLFRIIVPYCLFSQKVKDKFFEAKIRGEEPPLYQRFALGFPLCRRQFVLHQREQRCTDLLTVAHRTLNGHLRLQLPQGHDTLQHLIKGGQQRIRLRLSCRRDSENMKPHQESATQETQPTGETHQAMLHEIFYLCICTYLWPQCTLPIACLLYLIMILAACRPSRFAPEDATLCRQKASRGNVMPSPTGER